MIASKLILWHGYRNGSGFDLSENRNHGRVVDASADGDTLRFDGGPGAVWVTPSSSLVKLRAVRTQVRFRWDPVIVGQHRHNLIEGHLSFALYINPDGSLQGTILNQRNSWEGALSAPGTVPTGAWHTAEFVHDGISHCALYLDGHVVAEGFSSPGPVRSVGPHGVAIAHWPEPDDRYTLEGALDEVRVWCDDPARDVGSLIGCCCFDREAVAQQLEAFQPKDPGPVGVAPGPGPDAGPGGGPGGLAAGVDSRRLDALARELLDTGREAASYLASGSSGERDHALNLAGQFLLAYDRRDTGTMMALTQQTAALLQARTPAAELQALTDRVTGVFEQVPFGPELLKGEIPDGLRDWFAPWCLDDVLPPKPPRREPPKTGDHSLDPGTDGPKGTGRSEPGTHEQVPPPELPPTDPEGPA